MGKTGVLTPDDRVELLEGWIVEKMNHNPMHDASVDLSHEAIRAFLPMGWRIRIQSAITTADSEPEPDLAVVQGSPRDFSERHPGPKDIALVIEVADSSLTKDRRKRRLHARANIAHYWIVNLVDRCIETYTEPVASPADPKYQREEFFEFDDSIPLVIGGRNVGEVAVSNLLP